MRVKGFQILLSSFYQVLRDPLLFRWFLKTAFKCFLFALLVIAILVGLGSYWITSLGNSLWWDVGAFFYALLVLFFSATLVGALMAGGAGFLVNEKELLRALSRNPQLQLRKARKGDFFREIKAALRSGFFAILAWPFTIFIITLPIAIILLAWALAKEAWLSGGRIAYQGGVDDPKSSLDSAEALSLGALPAALTLFPIIGWIVWPLLMLACTREQFSLSQKGAPPF